MRNGSCASTTPTYYRDRVLRIDRDESPAFLRYILALVARLRVFSTARDLRFELFRAFDAFDARRICFRAVFGYADSIIRAAETGPMEILPESARHVDSLLRGRPSPGVPPPRTSRAHGSRTQAARGDPRRRASANATRRTGRGTGTRAARVSRARGATRGEPARARARTTRAGPAGAGRFRARARRDERRGRAAALQGGPPPRDVGGETVPLGL